MIIGVLEPQHLFYMIFFKYDWFFTNYTLLMFQNCLINICTALDDGHVKTLQMNTIISSKMNSNLEV